MNGFLLARVASLFISPAVIVWAFPAMGLDVGGGLLGYVMGAFVMFVVWITLNMERELTK